MAKHMASRRLNLVGVFLLSSVLMACNNNQVIDLKDDVKQSTPTPTETLKKIDDTFANAGKITKASDVKIAIIPFEFKLPKSIKDTCVTPAQAGQLSCPTIKINLLKTNPVWIGERVNQQISGDDNPNYLKFKRNLTDFAVRHVGDERRMDKEHHWIITPKRLNDHHNVVQIAIHQQTKIGGHQSDKVETMLFDMALQSQIDLQDVIDPANKQVATATLIAALFGESYDKFIKHWDNESDLLADKDSFVLMMNKVFYFNDEGLVFVYQPSHLTPDAKPELVIPYDKLQGIIRAEYLPTNNPSQQATAN